MISSYQIRKNRNFFLVSMKNCLFQILFTVSALALAAEKKTSSEAESKDSNTSNDDKNQKKRGLDFGSFHDFGGDLGGHGLDLGGHDFGGHHEIKTITIEKKVTSPNIIIERNFSITFKFFQIKPFDSFRYHIQYLIQFHIQ